MQPYNFVRTTACLACIGAYATAISSICPSVCQTVTCVDCIKTADFIIKILSLSDRIILLIFRHQGSLRKSDGFTAKAPNTRGKGSDFQPMRLCLGNSNR